MTPKAVIYDDGRPGHVGVPGAVLGVDDGGMLVHFVDRASPTRIHWHDMGWMMHLRPVCPRCEGAAVWVGSADGRRVVHCTCRASRVDETAHYRGS